MAYPKHHLFIRDERDLAHFGFVISHPARLAILQSLSQHVILSKCDFTNIPLSRSAISSHLRYLERAQLIELAEGPRGDTGYRLIEDNYLMYIDGLKSWLKTTSVKLAA